MGITICSLYRHRNAAPMRHRAFGSRTTFRVDRKVRCEGPPESFPSDFSSLAPKAFRTRDRCFSNFHNVLYGEERVNSTETANFGRCVLCVRENEICILGSYKEDCECRVCEKNWSIRRV